MMELRRELEDVATEGRSMFQECRDVFIAEIGAMQQRILGLPADFQEVFSEI